MGTHHYLFIAAGLCVLWAACTGPRKARPVPHKVFRAGQRVRPARPVYSTLHAAKCPGRVVGGMGGVVMVRWATDGAQLSHWRGNAMLVTWAGLPPEQLESC